jgi:hypothetical protein
MTSARPPTETETLRTVERAIKDRLPPGWSLRSITEPRRSQRRIDAIWRLRSPDGETVEFVAEVRRTVLPRSLSDTVAQLRAAIAQASTSAEPIVVAAYLSPRAQEVLTEQGVSFADTTGNIRLVATRPGLFILATGALKDPWPAEKTLHTLRGRGSGRAIRAIVDFRPPYGVRELAGRARVSSATLSRTIQLLAREALLTQGSRGTVTNVDWTGVIRRWSRDYEFRRSNHITPYIEPRGITALAAKLENAPWRHAVTGALAAQGFAPIAPARTVAIYAIDITQAAERLGLRPIDFGANVWLAEPFDPVVFDRTAIRGKLICVNPSQLAADLLTGTGREPSAGEELLEWMKDNEDAWRT